jgi:hypothetical protein
MDDVFDKLSTEEPARDEPEEEVDFSQRSASQQEEGAPNDSDLQTTLKMLNPTFSDPDFQDIAPVIMQGRVFPDNFFTKVHLLTIADAKANRHNKNFNYLFTLMKCEGMCQIGLEGKNRVETVIVSGNTKEVAEQENQNRNGGF